jgi:hypothetical protein
MTEIHRLGFSEVEMTDREDYIVMATGEPWAPVSDVKIPT